MPVPTSDLARILDIVEQEGTGHALRFTAAAVAMHALVASGAANVHAADKVASVAYDLGEAFLFETAKRLIPKE